MDGMSDSNSKPPLPTSRTVSVMAPREIASAVPEDRTNAEISLPWASEANETPTDAADANATIQRSPGAAPTDDANATLQRAPESGRRPPQRSPSGAVPPPVPTARATPPPFPKASPKPPPSPPRPLGPGPGVLLNDSSLDARRPAPSASGRAGPDITPPPDATVNQRPKSSPPPSGDAIFTLSPTAAVRPPSPGKEPVSLAPLYPEERYENATEFARGGLGRVLRVFDKRLQRAIAMKEVLTRGGEMEARFLREAQITARLGHPSIVSLYDLGRWESGETFFTMKLVEGQSLDRVVIEKKSLPERLSLLSNAIDVCEAMAYAHSQGIIHRDLKPQNVLIGPFGETVVIDWGIAKDLRAQGSEESLAGPLDPDLAEHLTQAGAVLGTPSYMSPEQARGQNIDARGDVYALGAMLYFMLSGRPPYASETRKSGVAVLGALLEGPPPPIEEREPDIPKDLAAIIKKAMAREVTERYPSARELAADLKKFQTGQVVGAYQYTSLELVKRFLRKNRTSVIVVGVLLYVLVMGLTYSYVRISQAREGERVARLQAEDRAAVAAAAESERARKALALTWQLARSSLNEAPALTLSYLKELIGYPGFSDWRALRTLAADAISRGIPRSLGAPWSGGPGHTAPVTSAIFSPDGGLVASASIDHSVFLWDSSSGAVRATLLGHADAATALAFSPDGRFLASGGGAADQTIRLWEVASGKEARALLGHSGAITALAFSPDGTLLASASSDQTVRLWRMGEAEPVATFAGHEGPVSSVIVSPDGKLLASIGDDLTVRVWDVAAGAPLAALSGFTERPYAVAFSPDSALLAAAGEDLTVRVWDLRGGRPSPAPVLSLAGHRWKVRALAFSPDGKRLASAGEDRAVRLWPLSECRRGPCRPALLDHHQGSVLTLSFSPDGRALASAGQDQSVRLWEVESGREMLTLRGHAAAIRTVSFSPDGRRLLSAGDEPWPVLWELGEIEHRVLSKHAGFVFAVDVSPDGKLLASGGEDNTIYLWDTATWGPLRSFTAADDVWDVKFSPDGAWLAAGTADGKIVAWELASGRRVLEIAAHERDTYSIGFSFDGSRLASASPDQTVKLWGFPSGEPLATLRGHEDEVIDLAFLPKTMIVATTGFDGTVRLWDTDTAKPLATLDVHNDSVRRRCSSVAFSPSGQLMAVGDYNAEVQLFRINELGSPLGPPKVLKAHSGEVEALAFSPDGLSLASASWDGTVRLHSISLDDWDGLWESRAMQSYGRDVDAVVFSPDGRFLAFASEDEKVHVFTDDLPREPEALRAWLMAQQTAPTETRAASSPAR